jgi:hypothetical protein
MPNFILSFFVTGYTELHGLIFFLSVQIRETCAEPVEVSVAEHYLSGIMSEYLGFYLTFVLGVVYFGARKADWQFATQAEVAE